MLRLNQPLLPLLGAVAAGLMSATPAAAAGQPVSLRSSSGDRAALTLSSSTKREFARGRLALRANRPATRKGASAYFPEKSGKWNFSNTSGSVTYAGASRLVRGSRSVKLTDLTFQRTVKGKKSTASLTARIGKRRLSLFTLTGRVRVRVQGTRETVSGLTATVNKPAAKLLDAALKRRIFTFKQRLGSFSITLSSLAVSAPGTGGGTPSGVSSSFRSGVGVAFTPTFQQTLASTGLTATPIAPAASGAIDALSGTTVPAVDGTGLTFPTAGGIPAGSATFNDGTLTGAIPLTGGIQLGGGLGAVDLTSPELTLGTGTSGSTLGLSVNGGPEVDLFDIDTSQLEAAATPNGQLSLSGLLAEVSSQGATTLNQLTGKQVFSTGQPVGGVTVIVPSTSATAASEALPPLSPANPGRLLMGRLAGPPIYP